MPNTPYKTDLPADLRALKEEIEQHARSYGLDFYETIFEVVDADDLNEIASYGGFPTRYPHWSFGMAYEELKKSYDYGLSKIYEMVINNDPVYAYLMRCNHTVDQKLVMAHVYGHADFFKNNAYFAHTSRKMMDEMANHGARIRRYVEKYGEDEVEAFLDRCMSIDDLIDVHSVAIKRREEISRYDFRPEEENDDQLKPTRFKSKDYMDDYINPRAVLKAEEEERKKLREQTARAFPERPEKDILLFLIEHAPLKGWQRDILSIVRDEAYYFAPQGMTKIMNEGWACVTAETLVWTDRGLVPMKGLVEHCQGVRVSDGEQWRPVIDHAIFRDRQTVKLVTRRGFEIEGSVTHRLQLPDGSWRRLDEFQTGDPVRLAAPESWPDGEVSLSWKPIRRLTLQEAANRLGVDIETVIRARAGRKSRQPTPELTAAVAEYNAGLATMGPSQRRRKAIKVPTAVNESVAAILGYLIGDGHVSVVKNVIGLTTGDEEQADTFAALVTEAFGIKPRKKWDNGRWRVLFSSQDARDLLIHLGLKTGVSARIKEVPEVILRSPKPVVASFLRAYFDCDAYAGKQGVILSTSSDQLAKVVQLLLLNFGILSRRRRQKDGCWHVHIAGRASEVFEKEVGFGLGRKRAALRSYVASHRWFKKDDEADVVVSVERGKADVFDITVETSHRYAAQGFVNHNSYWHSTIMTQHALEPWECIDYADHHSGTMATYGARLNPYKLGIELLRDIEHRWNTGKFGLEWEQCDDLEKKRNWDKKLGLGRQKIFEVRRVHNDITFIDTFLTPEFCREHKMFSYAFQDQAGQYVIESREFEKVKQRLLYGLTNFGKPWIYVVDGNYRNRGELLLKHEHNGVDLKLDHATETLANLQFIWSRPVHLQTIVEGKPTLLSFDGNEHSMKTGGESDEPKRGTSGKTR